MKDAITPAANQFNAQKKKFKAAAFPNEHSASLSVAEVRVTVQCASCAAFQLVFDQTFTKPKYGAKTRLTWQSGKDAGVNIFMVSQLPIILAIHAMFFQR